MTQAISHIFIRADASSIIGHGHVMRMLVLADMFQKKQITVTFICAKLDGHLIARIGERGYEVITCDQIDDHTWCETIENPTTSLIVVDHYELGITYESALIEKKFNVLAVDDLARAHNCHYLLDSSLHDSMSIRYIDKLPHHATRFLGPDYALANPAFAEHARTRNQFKRLLVCMGGADSDNATKVILEGLKNTSFDCDVVIGANHPDPGGIENVCKAMPHVTLHHNVSDIVTLMTRADIAILSGGVMLLEAMANQLPTIGICLADNQRGTLQTLSTQQQIYYPETIISAAINESLSSMLNTPRFPTLSIGSKLNDMIDEIMERL